MRWSVPTPIQVCWDQNRALLRAADEDVASAAATLKPILRWSASLTQNFGSIRNSSSPVSIDNDDLTAAVSLAAELVLYDFGSRQFRVESAKETVLATREALLDIEQQILLRAVSAYMGVIEASEFVALRENNVRLLTQEQRAAQDRFEVGEVTRTDVSLAEAQLAQARSGLAAARGDLVSAIEEYRNVVGRAPGRLTQPPSLPAVREDVNAAKAVAVRNHPSMRAAQHQVAAADMLVKATEADMRPSVNLTGRLSLTENLNANEFNRGGSIGLEAGQTIYQGGALSATNRQAKGTRGCAAWQPARGAPQRPAGCGQRLCHADHGASTAGRVRAAGARRAYRVPWYPGRSVIGGANNAGCVGCRAVLARCAVLAGVSARRSLCGGLSHPVFHRAVDGQRPWLAGATLRSDRVLQPGQRQPCQAIQAGPGTGPCVAGAPERLTIFTAPLWESSRHASL